MSRENTDLENKFLAQTASKRLITIVVGSIATYIAVGVFAIGAFSFFLTVPLVLAALLYYWFQHRPLLSKLSIISAIAFVLFGCWRILTLFFSY